MRFLESLKDSDFPKQFPLYSMIGWGWGSRERGVRDMMKLNPTYILCSDNDVIVPPLWWSYFKKIFENDTTVGAIGAITHGKYPWVPKPVESIQKGDYLLCPKGVSDAFLCYRTSALVKDGQISAYGLSLVYNAAASQYVVVEHSEPQGFIFKVPRPEEAPTIIDCTDSNYLAQ